MKDKNVRTEIQKWLDNTWDNFPPAKMAIVSKNIPTLKDRTNLLAQLDSIGIILRTK